MNIIDQLIENTIKTRNPVVVGLDPDLHKIPMCYKRRVNVNSGALSAVAEVICQFNRDIIDTVASLVPAVKPQVAFYEKYGSYGLFALEQTVSYARSKGLIVIEDAKRNDIGNTAQAYADGHLGMVEVLGGERIFSVNADFLTVTPFLGRESLQPFLNVCHSYNKGIFVLVKTSNSSSGEIQDVITENGLSISQCIARYIAEQAETFVGAYGYSPIGAVVGATYPGEAAVLRDMMPHSYFLVPGYGAQGGRAEDILPCFRADGLGAIVNSSRGILYTHMSDEERETCDREEYLNNVRCSVLKMQQDIYETLRLKYPSMIY